MNKLLREIYDKLAFNFKSLILFELIYRLVGILIIYPLGRLIFYTAIELSGYEYITNRMFLDFLFKPTTLLMGVLFFIIISLYIVIEMVFLAIIFDYSHQKRDLSIASLLIIGSKRSLTTLKKYHILVIIPAALFFLILESFHLASIASTVNIPSYWLEQLENIDYLSVYSGLFLLILTVIFIETAFTLNYYSLEALPFKVAYKQSRMMLKNQRFWMIFEILFINILLSALLYILYALVVLLIGGIVYISRGQEFVLGFLLTLTYSLYYIIGIIATAILIPINYALLSTWYYTFKQNNHLRIKRIVTHYKDIELAKIKNYRRLFYTVIIIIFAINITNIFTIIYGEENISLLNPPSVIAHRGASIDAPENTISAFDEAINQGADALELDIRFTADGIPIVMHDRTLSRTTNETENSLVRHLTLAQIKALDAGQWFGEDFEDEAIPTLEEVLILYGQNTDLYIELKDYDEESEQLIVELIETYADIDRIKIMSFNDLQLIRFKELNPEIQTVLLVSTFYGNLSSLINKEYVDHFAFEQSLILNNPSYVDRIQSVNKGVYVWTVNNEEYIGEYAELYVNGIITDKPLITREIVYGEPNRSLLSRIINELFTTRNQGIN